MKAIWIRYRIQKEEKEVTKIIMVREELFVTIKYKEEAFAEEQQTIKD